MGEGDERKIFFKRDAFEARAESGRWERFQEVYDRAKEKILQALNEQVTDVEDVEEQLHELYDEIIGGFLSDDGAFYDQFETFLTTFKMTIEAERPELSHVDMDPICEVIMDCYDEFIEDREIDADELDGAPIVNNFSPKKEE